jgi:hypothetical protein
VVCCVSDFPDEFFDDVLEGRDSDHLAVLVDDPGHVRTLCLHRLKRIDQGVTFADVRELSDPTILDHLCSPVRVMAEDILDVQVSDQASRFTDHGEP